MMQVAVRRLLQPGACLPTLHLSGIAQQSH